MSDQGNVQKEPITSYQTRKQGCYHKNLHLYQNVSRINHEKLPKSKGGTIRALTVINKYTSESLNLWVYKDIFKDNMHILKALYYLLLEDTRKPNCYYKNW